MTITHTHSSLCSIFERMNRKWCALVSIHYSLSTVLLHVNKLRSDTVRALFPLSLTASLFLSYLVARILCTIGRKLLREPVT